MAIPQEDWLHHAKRLAIGGKNRVQHGRESRPSMVVGNDSDKWWCYCQSCKQGGVLMKEHVRVTNVPAPKDSESLVLPHDMVPLLQAEPAVRDGVLGFLAHKNMDAQYLPELYFSPLRKRLMLKTAQGWLGRDTTGRSPQKWLSFDDAPYLGPVIVPRAKVAIVVEDPFSYYKVAWAGQALYAHDVYASLGTTIRDKLMLRLLPYDNVMMFYDGDVAGNMGAEREAHRLRAFNVQAVEKCAPRTMDPKDMTIDEIRKHIGG